VSGTLLVSGALNAEPNLQTSDGPELPANGSQPLSAAEGYQRWAPIYDDTANPLLAREERYLLPLIVDAGGKGVLDLACGTGRWLEKLAARGCKRGVGIDCSIAMLEVAGKKHFIRKRLANANCESLPFSDAAFDLAICSFAMGHLEDLETATRELARVTKPGANIFVSDLHPDAYARGWQVGFRDAETAVRIESRSRSVEEITQVFCSNGFECRTQVSLWLGEPERPLFVQAGRSDSFADACRWPAVLVCQFRRLPAEEQL
jgi:ubiquinone/menaquinone biosynthesis C-methylase UbiE